ncbi:MAG TPA: transcriptional repressor [Saprospiraceae bacterium]|nr:transcriptional repressor [Saprospiraceae bacterium]
MEIHQLSWKEVLNSRSLKATQVRLKLLQILEQRTSATPYSILVKSMTPIDRVTLYRTLESLLNQGIIHEAYSEHEETYFALCGRECNEVNHNHKHIHFKCIRCNEVTCIHASLPHEIEIPGVEIHHWSIVATGICNHCCKA